MPLVIILAAVAIVIMYYRFRTAGHLRDCRWREDRAGGVCICMECGARLVCQKGELPKICLKGQTGAEKTGKKG